MPDATPIAPSAKPRRRWYQYSLRTLFVVVTLLCVCVGVVVKLVVIPAERQRAAVATIERLKGNVVYFKIPNDESWFRQTLRKLLPTDYFDDVKSVDVENCPKVSDADWAFLDDLPKLWDLHLGGPQVTDAALVHIRGLTQLDKLSLNGTSVTDAGLANLQGLTQLRELYLGNTQVTDAGLSYLEDLTKIYLINLANTRVDGTGLTHLKGVYYLYLDGTQVTDTGLAHWKGLAHVLILSIDRTQVTSDGVARLRRALPYLEIEPREASPPQ